MQTRQNTVKKKVTIILNEGLLVGRDEVVWVASLFLDTFKSRHIWKSPPEATEEQQGRTDLSGAVQGEDTNPEVRLPCRTATSQGHQWAQEVRAKDNLWPLCWARGTETRVRTCWCGTGDACCPTPRAAVQAGNHIMAWLAVAFLNEKVRTPTGTGGNELCS